jgi:hypothetical protein
MNKTFLLFMPWLVSFVVAFAQPDVRIVCDPDCSPGQHTDLNHAADMNEAADTQTQNPAKVNNPKNFTDLTGQRFGRLVVIKRGQNLAARTGTVYYECQCDCGNIKTICRNGLKSGDVKSCGCFRRETKLTHGQNNSITYSTWEHMKGRCFNTKNDSYNDYGGRGITVCEQWLKFENFLSDMGERPSADHSIERLDNDGNYEPGNCVWATIDKQSRNKRNNHLIEFRGVVMNELDWSVRLGMTSNAVGRRIKRGWSVERALTTPSTK